MNYSRILSLAVLAGHMTLFGVAQLSAQNLGQPAEFPPTSFKGKQYVDSRGCVFIRAGIDGNTTWVPRVTRDRRPICGQNPTYAEGRAPLNEDPRGKKGVTVIGAETATASAEAAPAPKPSAPVRVATTRPAPAAQPAPQPQRVVRSASATAPARTAVAARRPAATATAPVASARVVAPVVAPVAPMAAAPKAQERIVKRAVRRVEPGATARAGQRLANSPCPGLSGNSARYYGTSGLPVRCGTQFEAQGYVQVDAARVQGQTRIMPRAAYEERRLSGPEPVVPKGYREVWEDDRLNRERAVGTVDGYRQMDLVWTRTVPRRLIDRSTGKDVTLKYRTLLYPFTDATMQAAWQANPERYEVQVSQRTGAVRLVDGFGGRDVVAPAPIISSQAAARKPAVKTAAPAVKPRAAAASAAPKAVRVGKGHRYVQVGVFGDAANAERTIRRLHALGLPVGKKVRKSGGKNVTVIVAGPFRSPGALATGLTRVRGAGYADAYTR